MAVHIGKLGTVTISAQTEVIVRFADGAFLDFPTRKEASGFLKFYHTSHTARTQNPGKIYVLKDGVWTEVPKE